MAGQRLEELLQELGRRGTEPAPQGLAERIKRQIPDRLMAQRWGRDTVNIMVHLKISRVAAVAAIVVTLIVFGGFFGRGSGWYQGIEDLFSRQDRSAAGLAKVYQEMASNGVEVVYYEQNANSKDPTLILMYWKLPEGDYRVVFTNGRVVLASAEQLVKLQSNTIRSMGQ